MTCTKYTPVNPLSIVAHQAKEERRKVLEEVRKRRYQNSQNRLKHQPQAYQENEEYREYQDMIASSQ